MTKKKEKKKKKIKLTLTSKSEDEILKTLDDTAKKKKPLDDNGLERTETHYHFV